MTTPHYVVGLVLTGDDLELTSCYLADRDDRVRRDPIGYGVTEQAGAAVVVAADGSEVARYPLRRRTTCVDGGPPSTRLGAVVPVPEPGAAAAVRFVVEDEPGRPSLVVDLGTPPAVLEIVHGPAPGEVVNDRVDLVVRAETEDAEPVRALAVRLSRDGGRTSVRAPALAAPRADGLWDVEVVLGEGLGSDECLLEVQARAGLVPATVTTARFTLLPVPPELVITAPPRGHRGRAGTPLVLSARVVEPTTGAGELTDTGIRWRSDVDGHLGTGSPLVATLTAGRHLLDASLGGLTAAVAVTITTDDVV